MVAITLSTTVLAYAVLPSGGESGEGAEWGVMQPRTSILQIKPGLYYAMIKNEHGRELERHAWGTRENAEQWLREAIKPYQDAAQIQIVRDAVTQ